MFRGLYEHNMDAKGRLSVPTGLRGALRLMAGEHEAQTLVVTTGIDACLVAYPLSEWRALEDKLSKLSHFDPAVVKIRRIYIAGATECALDKHGRLLIPPMLRSYAGLTKEVVWAGMGNTIEIWAKEAWDAQMKDLRGDSSDVAASLAALGL